MRTLSTLFAVDGGGSKTDAALVREDGTLVGFARGPLSQPDHIGVEESARVVGALAAEVGAPAALAVLRAGSERGWGVAVTCGSGINCVGVGPDGRRVRFPSLGAISGDWGGAGDVGLAAVSAAARSEDGRGPKTELERLVPEHFGLATPVELARAILAGTVARSGIADLAPLVFAAAETDVVAAEIVDRQAAEVVALAGAALARLELAQEDVDVVLGGGLLQSGNGRLLAGIEAGLREVGPRLAVRVASSRPIVGAVLLGLDRLSALPQAYERARAELDRATASLSTSLGDVAGDAAAVGELS